MVKLKVNGIPIRGVTVVAVERTNSTGVSSYSDQEITISAKDPRSYTEWYTSFVGSKQLAMMNSGSSDSYNFTKPFTASCVRSINNVTPDSLGNITLLGSKIVDVSEHIGEDGSPIVSVSRLLLAGGLVEQLKELYLFTMRLYEAINSVSKRLLVFDPESWKDTPVLSMGKSRGTLLNYQANVARWNFLVWKSSYTQIIESSRQNLALSLGYSCVTCRILGAKITTTITKDRAQDTEIEGKDSAHCLTIYRQSVSDNRQDKSEAVITKITKTFENSDEETEIFGFGMDSRYDNWDTITIEQTLPAMSQSDKYSELFSLSLGMGVTAYVYLSKDDNPAVSRNFFDITTKWEITTESGEVTEMVKSYSADAAAVNVKELEEGTESEEA